MTEETPSGSRHRPHRFVVEGFVIVTSILLAFAIDAGWAERQERRSEEAVLGALTAEFEEYRDWFNFRSAFYEETTEIIAWFLDEAEFTSSEMERLDRAMLAFVGVPTVERGTGVPAELVASGRVSLISDPILRRYVSTWEGVLAESADNEEVVREYALSVLVPYLASRQVPIGRASRIPRQPEWQLSVASETEALAAYRALAQDPEFRVLASWRYEWAIGSSRDFRHAAATADSALVRARTGLDG